MTISNIEIGDSIEIIDLQGNNLKKIVAPSKTTNIDIADLREGHYFVIIDGKNVFRFIKK